MREYKEIEVAVAGTGHVGLSIATLLPIILSKPSWVLSVPASTRPSPPSSVPASTRSTIRTEWID